MHGGKNCDEKGLKVNVKKTKAFCTGKKTVAMKTSKFLSTICRRGVGGTSVLCIKCNCWVHDTLKYVSV